MKQPILKMGATAAEMSDAIEGAAVAIRKFGLSYFKLIAPQRYKLHRRAKRFGAVVKSRQRIVFINYQKLESLNKRQRATIDTLIEFGYSVQTEI